MLILSRRIDEVIRIGDDVTLTILSVKGKQVRIGIDAPKGVPVHREEIWQRIQEQAETSIDDKASQIELAYQERERDASK